MLAKLSMVVAMGAFIATIPGVTATQKNNIVDIEVEEVIEKTWKCAGCTPEENFTLAYLQDNTLIRDKNALATILGNIKQESRFLPNICEGGARVTYENCHSGGYGLIQWTTLNRYKNLGLFCNKYGCDPSSLEGQVRYMVNERGFQNNLPYFEGVGQTINQYMNAAYRWLGWGIHGARTEYAYQYLGKLHYS